MNINTQLQPNDFTQKLQRFWQLSAEKIRRIEQTFDVSKGAPVFTKNGRYTLQGWTDWTQGFQFGSALLQFDATGDTTFLESGRTATRDMMTPHVTHFGVHDHGFNNMSTYGNLWRFMNEGKIEENAWERAFYEMALKCSGAVQARRWTNLKSDEGYIYSFNGPHSLFIDTIRTVRSLAVAHVLGHQLKTENDRAVSLLERLVIHAATTAKYAVYYGEGRDSYDVRGRVAHESIFNTTDGNYRCPNSQQGFSPFTTWTRGLAWAILGFAEELEFIATLDDAELKPWGEKSDTIGMLLTAAMTTADFYIQNTPLDGIPYWDTGAPKIHRIEHLLEKPADPFNAHEPVDSSAAAITAQGLLRLGHYLHQAGDNLQGSTYWQAGLSILDALLQEPYISPHPEHEGLILHSLYHRPNGWDLIPDGQQVPCGEATMWGDYHAREAALYLQRILNNEAYYTFFSNDRNYA